MSDNFVQVATGSGTTTAPVTLAGVVGGNDISVCFGIGSSSTPTIFSVADAQGAYTPRGALVQDAADAVAVQWFTLENANAGTHNIVGTSDSGSALDIIAVEVGTTAGASAFSGANQAHQSAPGTGTDGLSSGNVTVTAASTLLGISFDSASTNTADEPVAGTGFTSRLAALSTACGVYRLESKAVSATAPATFTAVLGASEFLTLGIAILNASATPPPTITLMGQVCL